MNTALIRAYLNARSTLRSLFGKHSPPKQIPEGLTEEFTLDGRVPVLPWYINDVSSAPLKWTRRAGRALHRRAEAKKSWYYGDLDQHLFRALDAHSISGKHVVIIGSESPWYECICQHYGAEVTTIEYRRVACEIPGLTVMTPDEFEQRPSQFDVVLSISSIEHDGLGRYGDPINPRGDLQAMEHFKTLLRPGGMLILAVPIGPDALVWNAHRIYGRTRLPMLLDGWDMVDSFGYSESLFDAEPGRWDLQPVLVLQPNGKPAASASAAASTAGLID